MLAWSVDELMNLKVDYIDTYLKITGSFVTSYFDPCKVKKSGCNRPSVLQRLLSDAEVDLKFYLFCASATGSL